MTIIMTEHMDLPVDEAWGMQYPIESATSAGCNPKTAAK
jgi:hypothetical protein